MAVLSLWKPFWATSCESSRHFTPFSKSDHNVSRGHWMNSRLMAQMLTQLVINTEVNLQLFGQLLLSGSHLSLKERYWIFSLTYAIVQKLQVNCQNPLWKYVSEHLRWLHLNLHNYTFFLLLLQVKNRTKKHCRVWRTRPRVNEQHATCPPPPICLLPALGPVPSQFSTGFVLQPTLSTFSSISNNLSHLLPCMHVISRSPRNPCGSSFPLPTGFYLSFGHRLQACTLLRFVFSYGFYFSIFISVSSVAKYSCLYLLHIYEFI